MKNRTKKKSPEKRKRGTSKPPPKDPALRIREPEQVEQQVTPPIQNLILTYHIGLKQEVVKRNIL